MRPIAAASRSDNMLPSERSQTVPSRLRLRSHLGCSRRSSIVTSPIAVSNLTRLTPQTSARSSPNRAKVPSGSGMTTPASSGLSIPSTLATSSALSTASRRFITADHSRSHRPERSSGPQRWTLASSDRSSARNASSAVCGTTGSSRRQSRLEIACMTVCVRRRRGDDAVSQ